MPKPIYFNIWFELTNGRKYHYKGAISSYVHEVLRYKNLKKINIKKI